MDEKTLREKIKSEMKEITLDALPKYIDDTLALIDMDNMDEAYGAICEAYGAICIAIGGLAATTAWAINNSEKGGISGFQASCIMWEFLDMFNHIKEPARLIQMEDMLYPQNEERFNSISAEQWRQLQEKASICLKDCDAHPDVAAHWQSVVSGKVPFGYKVLAE